ncbi:putative ubiquitin carboxyl-terminal hydrolase 3 [Russula decolorans]
MHLLLHWHQSQHPYRIRRRNLTMEVSPLSPIPRTLLSPPGPSVPPSPPLIQLPVPRFHTYVLELDDLKGQRGAGVPDSGGGATPLVDATVRFVKEFIVEEESPSTQSQPATGRASRADSFEPTYMYDAMQEKRQLKPLLDGQQQDAEEFLCLYLDALEEEVPALLASISGRLSASTALEVEKREVSQSDQTEVRIQGFMANFIKSPIARIFGGKFRSPIRGPNQPDPVPTEDWRSLHLDIQHDSIRTVQDALAPISQSQFVQISASGLGNASQQVLIEALPPVLVLHLNRVRYDAAAGGITKIGKSIQFAPELEISLDIMVPNAQRPSGPPHYKLYGVLYHHGESAGSGHYTVDVLHPNGNGDTGEGWLHIDNEVVSPMRHEDVFREHGSERAADERCAYLLFYCRTPTET